MKGMNESALPGVLKREKGFHGGGKRNKNVPAEGQAGKQHELEG